MLRSKPAKNDDYSSALHCSLLSLGSNRGDRVDNIRQALSRLSTECNILTTSSYYETEPFGNAKQPPFINIATSINTNLSPIELLHFCKSIEVQMGRTSAPKWTERVIDIDILLYDSIIMDTPSLTIPHPYMHLRNFVLVPCNEIMPDAVHPILHKNIGELLALCNDNLYVQLFHNE